MTISPPSGVLQPQPEDPLSRGGSAICFAVALVLSIALAQAALARSYPALDDGPTYAVPAQLGNILADIDQVKPEVLEEEVQLAMLEVGPILYALALGEIPDQMPPVWRAYAIKSAAWVAAFILVVSTSAAMTERRAQRRRNLWRRRAAELYQ